MFKRPRRPTLGETCCPMFLKDMVRFCEYMACWIERAERSGRWGKVSGVVVTGFEARRKGGE